MEIFMLISSLLRLVGTALQNPAVSAGSDVLKYVGVLSSAAETGRLTVEELKAESERLTAMIAEDRPPTSEELAALRSLSDSLSNRIQNG